MFSFLCLVLSLACAIFPNICQKAAGQAPFLYAQSVVPALLPTFTAALMLEKSGAIDRVGKLLAKPGHLLLRTGGAGMAAVLLCWIAGFPTGAKVLCDMEENGSLQKNEAARCAVAGSVCSAGFVLAFAGRLGAQLGTAVLFCHIAAALLNGVLLSRTAQASTAMPVEKPKNKKASQAFSSALSQAGSAMIGVGVAMVLCRCVSALFFGESPASLMVLELTSACLEAAALPLPGAQKALVFCACVSFGSVSVYLQSLPYLTKFLSAWEYFLAKCGHALLSVGMLALYVRLYGWAAIFIACFAAVRGCLRLAQGSCGHWLRWYRAPLRHS